MDMHVYTTYYVIYQQIVVIPLLTSYHCFVCIHSSTETCVNKCFEKAGTHRRMHVHIGVCNIIQQIYVLFIYSAWTLVHTKVKTERLICAIENLKNDNRLTIYL